MNKKTATLIVAVLSVHCAVLYILQEGMGLTVAYSLPESETASIIHVSILSPILQSCSRVICSASPRHQEKIVRLNNDQPFLSLEAQHALFEIFYFLYFLKSFFCLRWRFPPLP